MEYTMDNVWVYIALGAIVIVGVLVIVIIQMMTNQNRKENIPLSSKAELSYRKSESKKLRKKIEKQLRRQDALLSDLRNKLRDNYNYVDKTYIDFTRNSNQELHYELSKYYDLSNERILYCHRYTRTFGSDSFFIITEKGFGYVPRREPKGFLYFEDVKELINLEYGKIRFIDNRDETILVVDSDDFTYNGISDTLVEEINKFLSKFQSPLDIYLDAGFEALDHKLTPILPDIIQHVGNYAEGWKLFLRAGYKYILAEDGVDVRHNTREAFDDITDIENSLQDNKNGAIFCGCELLRAKIMLLDKDADHMEIKKILDTVAGNAEDSHFKDEANIIRRQLKL